MTKQALSRVSRRASTKAPIRLAAQRGTRRALRIGRKDHHVGSPRVSINLGALELVDVDLVAVDELKEMDTSKIVLHDDDTVSIETMSDEVSNAIADFVADDIALREPLGKLYTVKNTGTRKTVKVHAANPEYALHLALNMKLAKSADKLVIVND